MEYNVDYSQDTEYSAHARLLQSKWRHAKGYPMGKYGNYLEGAFAKTAKVNFLTKRIQALATDEMINAKSSKALYDEGRMWSNLLSSQPLCFNLFGELSHDMKAATACFRQLFPDRIQHVNAVRFEYSPGRENPKYTGDRSAFDVFVEYERDGIKGFIGIEVKYAEALREESAKNAEASFRKHRGRYEELSRPELGVFKSDSIERLRRPPLSQIWRDHLLAIALMEHESRTYEEGLFVFLFPSQNRQCQNGVDAYAQHLASPDAMCNRFSPRYLEEFIDTIADYFGTEWSNELKSRYLGT
jgi:hypothetical protein